MLELARDDPEHPYRGGSSVWRAAVRRERLNGLHAQAVADVPIRFEGLPGEYLQVDWGEIRHFPFTQQQPVTRYFLACRLKYSRWTWVIFTDNMRQETLFRGLVACFNALQLCALGARVRQYEDGHGPVGMSAATDLAPLAAAVGRRIRLPSRSVLASVGQSEGFSREPGTTNS